jgi:hypothetical protein
MRSSCVWPTQARVRSAAFSPASSACSWRSATACAGGSGGLNAREERFDQHQEAHWRHIEEQLGKLRREHAALLGGYQLIAAALRMVDPHSDALRRADELLRSAFLVEPLSPPDMVETMRSIRRSDD